MIFDAEFFNTAYQILSILDRSCWQNSVAQIEYMPAAAAKTIQNTLCFQSYFILRSKQNARIEIALQGFLFADLGPRRGQIHCPVQPDHIAFDLVELVQGIYALGKNDHRSPVGFKPVA